MSPKAMSPHKTRTKLSPIKHRSKVKAPKQTSSSSPTNIGSSGEKVKTILVPSMFSATPLIDVKHKCVKAFMEWFRTLVDEHRESLPLYLAEDIVLEWFGRSVRSRKKVTGFLEHEVKTTRHCFTTVDVCAPFTARAHNSACAPPMGNEELATPLDKCATPATILNRSLTQLSMRGSSCKKRPATPSTPASSEHKKFKGHHMELDLDNETDTVGSTVVTRSSSKKSLWGREGEIDSGGGGDGREMAFITPPYKPKEEGDCQPKMHNNNVIGPCHYVEASGFIEFSRSRKRRGDVKWERKCRLRICYSIDKVRPNEYVIHMIVYSDSNKCRRNLLAEFEEVAREAEEKAKRKVELSKTSSSVT